MRFKNLGSTLVIENQRGHKKWPTGPVGFGVLSYIQLTSHGMDVTIIVKQYLALICPLRERFFRVGFSRYPAVPCYSLPAHFEASKALLRGPIEPRPPSDPIRGLSRFRPCRPRQRLACARVPEQDGPSTALVLAGQFHGCGPHFGLSRSIALWYRRARCFVSALHPLDVSHIHNDPGRWASATRSNRRFFQVKHRVGTGERSL